MTSAVLPTSASGQATPSLGAARLRRVGAVFAPALVYLTIRQVSLLVLAWMSAATGVDTRSALTSWDGAWFLGLAAGGYGGVPAELVDGFGMRTPQTSVAFFPGYPALVAAVSWVSGIGVTAAAFVVSAAAGVATAYGLVRLAETVPYGSRRAGLVLVALFAAAPMSIVLSMAYSEALFCALAVWCLLGLLRRQCLPECAALPRGWRAPRQQRWPPPWRWPDWSRCCVTERAGARGGGVGVETAGVRGRLCCSPQRSDRSSRLRRRPHRSLGRLVHAAAARLGVQVRWRARRGSYALTVWPYAI